MAGREEARRGLASGHERREWASVGAAYRELLLVKSGRAGRSGKVAVDGESIRRRLATGGELTLGEVLRVRVRYFSEGVALGTRAYVNEVFWEFRDRFGAQRKTGARPLRGLAALGHLATLRDLRMDAIG